MWIRNIQRKNNDELGQLFGEAADSSAQPIVSIWIGSARGHEEDDLWRIPLVLGIPEKEDNLATVDHTTSAHTASDTAAVILFFIGIIYYSIIIIGLE